MRTSRGLRGGVLGVGLILLAGCAGIGGGGETADRDVAVTSDAITITGPRGFCIDPTSIRDTGDTGFVLLGNCAAISGNARARQPDVAAVLTAAVSAPSDEAGLFETIGTLDGFFRSDAGRRVLSRSGEAETVEVLETRVVGNMFLLHARDSSGGAGAGVAQDYWRAYMDVGPRLATLSVLALSEPGVSDAAALETLTDFAEAVQRANSGGRTTGDAAAEPGNNGGAATGPFRRGRFQGIFR